MLPAADIARGTAGATLRLRWLLLGLVLAVLLPTLAIGVVATLHAIDSGRQAAEERLRDTAGALALAVERDVASMKAAAAAFSLSPTFGLHDRPQDLRELDGQARRLAIDLDAAVVVARPDGGLLLDTTQPAGAVPGRLDDLPLLGQVAATAAPAASDLTTAIRGGQPAFLVGVPVFDAQGAVALVTAVAAPVDRLQRLLGSGFVPAGGFASIADGGGRILARSDARHAAVVGRRISEESLAALSRGRTGVYRATAGDGVERVYGFRHLDTIPGWVMVVTETAAELDAAWRASLGGLALGSLGALGLAAALAMVGARLILGPLGRLERHARGFATGPNGAPPADAPPRRLRVTELETLRQASAAAYEAIAMRERLLADSAARLRLATEGTGIGTWEMDLLTGQARCSAEAALLAGLGRTVYGSGEWLAAIHPDDRAENRRSWRRALEHGETYEVECRTAAPAPDGGDRWILLRGRVERGPDGRPLRAAGLILDVTARRRAEIMAAESAARLGDTERNLHHLSRRVTSEAMARGLAHELSQPLAAIDALAGAAALSLEREPPEAEGIARARSALRQLGAQVARAGDIIGHLRRQLGRSDDLPQPAALGEVVREAVEFATAGFRTTRPVPVTVRVEGPDPRMALRRVALGQVVVNLVRNAIEAVAPLPDGPARRIAVTLRAVAGEPGMAEVEVADGGPGLPPDVASRLFEPFVSTKPEGMGLGLSICRAIVEAHGGDITATAPEGGGTVFRFTLRDLAPPVATR